MKIRKRKPKSTQEQIVNFLFSGGEATSNYWITETPEGKRTLHYRNNAGVEAFMMVDIEGITEASIKYLMTEGLVPVREA